ncbi:MAG: hypothetical protein JWO62_2406 [Acidimicrobiaceae bacterium]|nr:hypothetical protein [Acidimicrobiaceae bacterium]
MGTLSVARTRWADRLGPPLMLVAGALVCLSRSPAAILHPELYAEDGHVWFSDAYNKGWFAPLSVPHTGYLQTFPRLTAGLGLLVPLTRLPELFVLVAVVAQLLPAAFLASRRLEGVVASRATRLVLAAIYLVAPNAREVNANLTNAQWHLALLAVLVVLARPGSGPWRAFDVVAVALSGLTGPFCIALLPVVAVAYLVRRERWTLVLLVETAVLSTLQLAELLSSARGHYGPLGITWRRLVEILGSQIVGGTFLGQTTQFNSLIGPDGTAVSVLLLVAGSALVGAAIAFGPLELRLFNLYAALVLAASLLSPVASVKHVQWQALAFDPQMRYWLFPTLALLADALWLATGARPRALALLGVGLLVVAATLAVREDWRYRPLPKVAWAAEVRAFDATRPGQKFIFQIAPANWKMTLVKR